MYKGISIMAKLNKLKTTTVFIVVGIFLGAGILPPMNGNGLPGPSDVSFHIQKDIAIQVALATLSELGKTEFSLTEPLQIKNEKQEPLFYVFTLQPQGYLIVTGSYDLPPVIAYSFLNNYKEDTNINPLYDLLYADLTLRLQTIHLLPQDILQQRHLQWDSCMNGNSAPSQRFEQWPPEGTTPTGGWLLANWHQNAPYNDFCPLDIAHGGTRSVAGCPAVAIAQILNYHNTTMQIVFDDSDDYYHNYLGNQYWIDNNYEPYNFPSFPQLNSYLSILQSHYENHIPPTNDDKAAITFACGVAARQVYAASGSGTFNVNQAYQAYQRFNCSTAALLYPSSPDLYDRMLNNMKDALPAHLAVVNPQWTAGHNVVIDGYNTNDYYHVNFGWGGAYNGWYLIPDELPYSLTVIEGVIVDILKNTAVPDLTCDGTLDWVNATPNETVTGNFSVRNIGEAGSYLDWEIASFPSWGAWTFMPSDGNNLKPEDGPAIISVDVVVPDVENYLFTGEIKVINRENSNDFFLVPVFLHTGIKDHGKLSCTGSLTWTDVKPGETMTGSFSVENIGAPLSNLSWEIVSWPDWGTWTFASLEGTGLAPEDEPITINVSVIAPKKRNTEFTGEIVIVNAENSSDYDTIQVMLATPYKRHSFILNLFYAFMERFETILSLFRILCT